ncbi:MAG TPA: hypothetical protein PLH37_01890 [bacterium]|nr:hypothetical protein [bacterium]
MEDEQKKCTACGTIITDETKCACSENLCAACCTCDPDCSCGCQDK